MIHVAYTEKLAMDLIIGEEAEKIKQTNPANNEAKKKRKKKKQQKKKEQIEKEKKEKELKEKEEKDKKEREKLLQVGQSRSMQSLLLL